MNRRRFLCVGLLAAVLMVTFPACSAAATTPTTQSPTTSIKPSTTTTAPPVTTATAPVTTSATPTTTAPATRVDYVADIVSPKSLYTYRYTALSKIQEGDGAGTSSTFISESPHAPFCPTAPWSRGLVARLGERRPASR